MELVWYRMLGPLLGGSSFAFGLILAVALAGIGLGGLAYSLFGGRADARGFSLTCAAEALCLAVPFALGDRIAMWASLAQALDGAGFLGQVAVWGAIAMVVVFPAAFVAGVQFPLLLAWVGRGDDHVGQQVGLVYAWNTVGAIAGSLAGGFGLLPLLSAPGAWRLAVVLLVVLAVAASRRSFTAGSMAAIALSLLFALGPTAAWRHSGIGVGRGPKSGTPNTLRDFENLQRRSMIWDADGRESSVALTGSESYAFVVNGKVDGNARADAETQVMGGLIGAILHGHVKKAAVVGLGTGSTAGWLGSIPGIERVDVAELEPAILRVARDCAPVNRDVLDNPRVHLFLGDAREYLLTSREKYDLVFSEPSNPYRAGVASLFTQEFYRAVADRLADDGILVQWVQAYSVDAQTIRTIYATLGSVFPYVDTWVTAEPDMMLVASRKPIAFDVPTLRARIAGEPYKTALDQVWLADDLEGFLARFVARNQLARAVAKAEGESLNTDDQTLVEFGFARMATRHHGAFEVDDLRQTAAQRHEDHPPVSNGNVEWGLIQMRRLSMLAAQRESLPPAPPGAPEALRRRARAYSRWLDDECTGVLGDFGGEPTDPLERLMVAECRADAGDAAAEPLIDNLRPSRPVEADAFLARLRLKQNRVPEAAAALEAAFTGFQRNPWPLPLIMEHALSLAPQIARRDHAAGERLFTLLGKPFAVQSLDAKRRNVRVELAGIVDFNRLCRAEIAESEPWTPWNREFLSMRFNCYDANRDPLAARAQADLVRFLEAEPLPFSSGLSAP
jgi:spermidine synthase